MNSGPFKVGLFPVCWLAMKALWLTQGLSSPSPLSPEEEAWSHFGLEKRGFFTVSTKGLELKGGPAAESPLIREGKGLEAD